MKSSLIKIGSTPTLSFVTLRNIADFMGTLTNTKAKEFLNECGVLTDEINQQESSSSMIYHVLKILSLSSEDKNKDTLEKIIIESTNPVLYGSNNITQQEIITKYNEWLKLDDFELANFKGNVVFLDCEIIRLYGIPEMEKDFSSHIKSDVLERIAEIRYAYELLIEIIDSFSQDNVSEEAQINNFYIKLFKIVEEAIEYAHSHIENVFGKDDSETGIEYHYLVDKYSLMEGNYIQPYIYQDERRKDILYKPFLNLYSAKSEMEKAGMDWGAVKKRMDECYGILEDRFRRFGADAITSYPNKEYFSQIESTLSEESKKEKASKGTLTLYLKSGKIVFIAVSGNTYEGKIRPSSNGYLLLKYLMVQPIGIATSYFELAKHLNKQRENIDSDEERRVRDAVQAVRKILKLKNSDNPFITDYGFGLSCNPIIKQTER